MTTGSPGPMTAKKQMRDGVLGAHGDQRFLFRVKLNAVVRLVALGDLIAQTRDSARHRVTMVALIARGFGEFAYHVARRGAVGIAHPEIDDVESGGACFRAHVVDDGEDVRRQFCRCGRRVSSSNSPMGFPKTEGNSGRATGSEAVPTSSFDHNAPGEQPTSYVRIRVMGARPKRAVHYRHATWARASRRAVAAFVPPCLPLRPLAVR